MERAHLAVIPAQASTQKETTSTDQRSVLVEHAIVLLYTGYRNCYPHRRPCGYHGDPTRACSCPPSAVARYQKRISGPLLDRIDIHVEVPRVEYEKLTGKGEAESSAQARRRVLAARERQARRFAGSERVRVNADMGPAEVRKHCEVEASAQPLLRAAARAFRRVLKLAHDRGPGRGWADRRAATRGGAAIAARGGCGVSGRLHAVAICGHIMLR
ncbi:MAG TPA: ATP-binding protein [Ktedonobacterales bacterium]|nr:ATP-binding protein [Ktedonobacterales bacterium]